ncbi:hypothetical protein FIBSPDRAFT_873297, partial [Athelia psychrophila]
MYLSAHAVTDGRSPSIARLSPVEVFRASPSSSRSASQPPFERTDRERQPSAWNARAVSSLGCTAIQLDFFIGQHRRAKV